MTDSSVSIAELRNHPFLLLVLKDGENEGYFTPEFMHKTKQQLSDMSLRIASDNLSIIYADQIRKGCEIVLGMCNLGLLELCDNDTEKAKKIIQTESIVYCFRAGWAKYAELKKISPTFFEEISITSYAQAINDTSDIRAMHNILEKTGQQSAMLFNIYKSIASVYSANTILVDNDEEILQFEIQKFLNSAITLLLIDTDKKKYTNSLYEELITYLTTTEKDEIFDKVEAAIAKISQQLPLSAREYLQEKGLLEFTDLKGLIEQQLDIEVFIPDILELPISVINELHDDFDGGYDFHADDDEDLAYLIPDGK
ncbi:DUF6178 family protein [Pseudocolwellia agarivorans]|uniref:DUF6178 family protein n=1 Tax=Pseudocolwellia agarivorans TaxID=1911682 RepID=UPI000984F408|nr:DUF6178 family protein [Pseudocolwellia agarivorans]